MHLNDPEYFQLVSHRDQSWATFLEWYANRDKEDLERLGWFMERTRDGDRDEILDALASDDQLAQQIYCLASGAILELFTQNETRKRYETEATDD